MQCNVLTLNKINLLNRVGSKVPPSVWDHFLATESPLKLMKNAFCFTSKALFVLKIFKLFLLFGHVAKRLDQKDKVNFKFCDVTACPANICQHVFSVTTLCLPRRLEDVLQRCFKDLLQDISKTSWKTKNCYAEDFLKTSWRHVLKKSWRHVLKMSWRYVLKTS